VQHHALDRLDGRGEIGDQMMRIGIEADDRRVARKVAMLSSNCAAAENLVVHARQEILLKSADGVPPRSIAFQIPVRIDRTRPDCVSAL